VRIPSRRSESALVRAVQQGNPSLLIAGRIAVGAARVPLAELETAWNAPVSPGRSLVLVP